LTINNCFSVIYILISGCFVIYFLYNLLKLVYFIIQNPQEKHDGYVVIFTKGKLPTSTFFNYLFWDDSQALEQQEKQQIIQHELAHIRGKHTLDMIWSELLKCIFWFNPLLWNWQKSLQEIHEFIADAQVVKNISVQSYKNLIVKHFFESVDLSMAINLRNGFRQSQIQKRLLMMVKPQTPSHMKAKSLLALPIAAGMMFFFACQENEQVESLKNETTTEKSMAKSEKETPEVNAEPVGGINQLFTWLGGELKYPEVARNNKVEGKVFVEFIVSEDGSIKDVKVLKGIGGGCDEEALRVISQMPKWKPALKDGKAVNQKLTLPITFKLS
jgi:TonB family protein